MNIGITCYPTIGGSGVVATELGKLLAERGHSVHFITSSMPFRLGKFYRNIYYHEVDVNSYSVFQYPPYDLTLASRMAQVAEREKLDVIHVHYAIPHAISAYLAKKMLGDRLKVVTTLHGTDITVLGQDPGLRDLIRFGIEQSDAVTAVSQSLVDETKEQFALDKKIERIYNFVDKDEYYPRDARDIRRHYAEEHEKILIHISNFRPVKRVSDVVRIFERVHQTLPSKLILIGEGPDISLICKMLKEKGLDDDTYFLGKQEQVAHILSLSDLMLLPSEKESFGLVALEAMACGKPVISSDAGGLPEVVINGETGYTLPIGEVDRMAQKAVELLSDPDRYETFSRNALARARNCFNQDLIASQYEALYRSVQEKEEQPICKR